MTPVWMGQTTHDTTHTQHTHNIHNTRALRAEDNYRKMVLVNDLPVLLVRPIPFFSCLCRPSLTHCTLQNIVDPTGPEEFNALREQVCCLLPLLCVVCVECVACVECVVCCVLIKCQMLGLGG
jgi:hypothetical protein